MACVEPHSSPMNISGGIGASSVIASAAASAASSACVDRRLPSGRFPIWSWFCRKLTKADGGKPPDALSAPAAAAMGRDLALVGESRGQRAHDVPGGIAGIVLIVAVALAGQQDVPGVMVVVVPLRTILASWRIGARIEQARPVVVVLQHQVNRSPGFGGECPDGAAELLQDRRLAGLDDRLHGVEAQTIEPVVPQPVQRIADGERAHLRHPIVDGRAPWAYARRRRTPAHSGRDNSPRVRNGCRRRPGTPSARADARRRSAP